MWDTVGQDAGLQERVMLVQAAGARALTSVNTRQVRAILRVFVLDTSVLNIYSQLPRIIFHRT